MRVFATAFLILMAGIAGAKVAWGQQCQPRDMAVKHLAGEYNEQPIATGMVNRGVVEVLESRDGSSWTIIITLHNGCVGFIAAGENWQRLNPVYPVPGKQS